eukprot:scaffold4690_cov116-Cylindrotheca_fusiformis.AAC.11
MRSFFLAIAAIAASSVAPVMSATTEQPIQVELLVPSQMEQVVSDATGENLGHYGHPPDGCDKDEIAVQITGIPGAICTAKCTDFLPCPKDLPDGVTAQPTCALQDQEGNHYCVLLCKPGAAAAENDNNHFLRHSVSSNEDGCGEATCQPAQGAGICTYDA